MTDAGWAEKAVSKATTCPDGVSVVYAPTVEKLLKAEHARAIRILNKLEANALDKQEPECTRCYLQGIRDAKTALQRGRDKGGVK